MNTPTAIACSLATLATCHQAAVANTEPEIVSPLPEVNASFVAPVNAIEEASSEEVTVAIAPPENLPDERAIIPSNAPVPLVVPVEIVEIETLEASTIQAFDTQHSAAHWEENYTNPFPTLELDGDRETEMVENYENPFPTLEADSETGDDAITTVKSTEEYHYSVIRMDAIAQLDPSLQPESTTTHEESEPVDWGDSDDVPPPLPEEEVEESDDVPSDLGELQRRSSQARQPSLQLLLRSSVATSSDITNPLNTTGNIVFSNGAYLLATPRLGSRTQFIGTAGIQFTDIANSDANYNAFNLSAGIQQQFSSNMFARLGWNYERLDLDSNDLVDNSVRLTLLRQDQLARRLRLNSFYEFRANFGDTKPNELSQLSNTLGARLSYSLSPQWEAGLDYRLVLYTFDDSTEAGHQVSLVTTYRPNRTLSISGGLSYVAGSPRTQSPDDLNNLLLQVSVGINLPIAY